MTGHIDFFSLTRTVHAPHPRGAGGNWLDTFVAEGALTDAGRAYLTEVHEHDHLVFFLASPLGLLLWRTETTHIIDGLWFARRLEEAGVREAEGGLAAWLGVNENREAVLAAARKGLLSPSDPPPTPESVLQTMDDFLTGLRDLRLAIRLLTGDGAPPNPPIADFLRAANSGFRYLAMRSDLAPRNWITRRDASQPLYGELGFTAQQMWEAMAKLRELDFLVLNRVEPAVIKSWQSKWMSDPRYGPVVRYLESIGLRSIPARNLCGLALMGALDVATPPAHAESVVVEEELPSFRFEALAQAFSRSGMAPEELRMPAALRWLTDEARLPPMAPMYARAANGPLLGPRANWDPFRASGIDVPLLRYLEDARMDMLTWFERSMQERAEQQTSMNPLDFAPQTPKAPRLYSDAAAITPQDASGDEGLVRELMRWRARLAAEQVLGFVLGVPSLSKQSLVARVATGMSIQGCSAETIENMIRLFNDEFPVVADLTLTDLLQPEVIANSLISLSG